MTDYYKKYFLDIPPQIVENLKPLSIFEVGHDRKTIMTFTSEELPIPFGVGDIVRLNNSDFKIVSFDHTFYIGKLSNKKCQAFIVKEVNQKDNPDDYTKRKIEE